ncbi:hypothetical protein ACFWXH_11530 [Mesorhizobium sp. NPDC059054]|uniref:hypothetical protein n=1 Tax=Mesorhizobium sp. NPDC059054 TaxID=3346711 RepID=UPI0036A8D549
MVIACSKVTGAVQKNLLIFNTFTRPQRTGPEEGIPARKADIRGKDRSRKSGSGKARSLRHGSCPRNIPHRCAALKRLMLQFHGDHLVAADRGNIADALANRFFGMRLGMT